jgi:putative FmdB family regulatory protein
MPLYEYECEACGSRFERIQKFSDPPIEDCPTCGKKTLHKLVSSPAIKFKGPGFYINDYAKKDKKDTAGTEKSSSEKSSSEKSSSKDEKPAAADSSKPAAASSPTVAAPASSSSKDS